MLATLVVPGLTLGPLVRRLEVGTEGQRRRDDVEARAGDGQVVIGVALAVAPDDGRRVQVADE